MKNNHQNDTEINPEIKLYGLPWAFPGWVGGSNDTEAAFSGDLSPPPQPSPYTHPNLTASCT